MNTDSGIYVPARLVALAALSHWLSFGALVIAASKLINRKVFGKEQRRLGAGRDKDKPSG